MGRKKRFNLTRTAPFQWFKGLSRNAKLAIILAAILVVVGLLSVLFTRSNNPEPLPESTQEVQEIETANVQNATVILTEGTLEYKTLEKDWDLAPDDLKIEPGMMLRTVGAISRSVIGLEDGSEVRIDANSEVEINSLTTSRVIIKHTNGYVFSRVLPSDSRDFIIETTNAQFQSVGTSFRTTATGDEESVEVYQSSVREVVTNRTIQEGERLVVAENQEKVESRVERIDISSIKDDDFINWNKDRDLASDLFKDSLGYLSDFDGPEIEISDPKPSSTVKISQTESPVIKIKGKTEAGARLRVQSKSVSGSQAQDVNVGNDGNFETPELTGSIGNSVFEFVATDRRGNETKLNVSFTFSRETATQQQGIALTLNETVDQVNLAWGLVGLTAPNGVKVVYGEMNNPILNAPNTQSFSVESGESASISKADLNPDTTYTIRVCRFVVSSNSCDNYSNKVTVLVKTPPAPVTPPTP